MSRLRKIVAGVALSAASIGFLAMPSTAGAATQLTTMAHSGTIGGVSTETWCNSGYLRTAAGVVQATGTLGLQKGWVRSYYTRWLRTSTGGWLNYGSVWINGGNWTSMYTGDFGARTVLGAVNVPRGYIYTTTFEVTVTDLANTTQLGHGYYTPTMYEYVTGITSVSTPYCLMG